MDTELRFKNEWAYENPRPEVQALVPAAARRILDVGCSSGRLGEALKDRQPVEIVGIEIDPEYARAAESRLDRVIVTDVDHFEPGDDLGTFDCLLAADVLEHLIDPWSALARLVSVLEPGGTAVVSLPNVRFWQTFTKLGLRGTWPVHDQGIFDRSHLRWFTLRDATALLEGAGLRLQEVHPMYRLWPGDHRSEPQGRRFARTPLAPFFTFQYVLVAIKPGLAPAP